MGNQGSEQTGGQVATAYRKDGPFRVVAETVKTPRHPREASEFPYSLVFIRAIKTWLRLAGIKVTVVGAENIPTSGGGLLASNHTNYLDMVWVGVAAHVRGRRLVRFMAKKEVFDVPVVGTLMRSMHHVAVDRSAGASSVESAVGHLRRGELVGIFPEATISRSFELKEFKTGAVRIAQQAGVPLIPVITWGGQRIWTKGGKRHLGRTNTPVRIHVGEPVDSSGDPAAATARLKAAMAELLDNARAAYEEENGPYSGKESWRPASLGGGAPTLAEADEMDARDRAERQRRREQKGKK